MNRARDTVASNTPLAAPADSSSLPALTMQGITKRFGATVALDGVDFAVNRGEIHALLGENGAGKSTLMHILSGLMRPDAGVIRLEGKEIRLSSPRQARAYGIAMVHQHFTLVPAFTVAENLALDRPTIDPVERARSLGWPVDPNARIADLPVGAQQRVEIIKALATDAQLLIFDEPTAVLSPSEVEELFTVLRRLRDEGRTIILIAHKLAEILAVSDRVTVLRRGKNVAISPTPDTNAAQLAEWMVGTHDLTPFGGGQAPTLLPDAQRAGRGGEDNQGAASSAPTKALVLPPPNEDPLPNPPLRKGREPESSPPLTKGREGWGEKGARGLGITNLTLRGDRGETIIRDLTLEVKRGEIFGIGGVDGNGQTELAEALAGLRKIESGSIQWEDSTFHPGITPRIGYIPQDRRRAGLATTMSIEENLLFDAVRESAYRFGPFLKRKELRRHAASLVQQFDIRTTDALLPASALSGGNQQKIVVARAFRSEPELIIAVNPTRGLDIGATRFVHDQLRSAKERGAAVVLISTDLDELTALSDRAAILASGQLTEFHQEDSSAADIGLLLGGVKTAE